MISAQPIKKILIIGPAWIGDMVMAQTLFKLLKANHPQSIIDVLAPSWTLNLTQRMPEISQGINFPFGHGELNIIKRYRLAKLLKAHHYDQAIVLPGSFKSALTPWWAKIPHRTGWLGEWRYGILNDVRKLTSAVPLMIEQFAALGLDKKASLPPLEQFYPQLVVDQAQRQLTCAKFKINTDRPILALCPGAEYGPAKRWPEQYFASVAKEMLHKGWQVFIFGSNKDVPLAETILAETKHQCVNLAGKTSLLEAVDLLSLASAVITNDSGLMHIAAALHRPLIVIYGSSTPKFTPPLFKDVIIAHLGLKCSPCFKRTCPLEHLNCMKQLLPETIMANLSRLVTL